MTLGDPHIGAVTDQGSGSLPVGVKASEPGEHTSMQLRHLLSAVVVTATALAVELAPELAASGVAPTASVRAAEAEDGSVSTTTCVVDVVGALASRRLVVREVQNGAVVRQKTARKRLPYLPQSAGYLDARDTRDGYRLTLLAGRASGRADAVTLHFREWSPTMPVASRRAGPASLRARLLTAEGRVAYTIDGQGRLYRWRVLEQSSGRTSLTHVRFVRAGLRSVKTLAFYRRAVINGRTSDLLMVTTRAGALKQLRIPVDAPRADRSFVVKRGGWSRYSSLSLGTCTGGSDQMMIVAINANRSYANRFTLDHALRPTAADLSRQGRVGPGKSWRLHGAF